jgi:glycosyltransferase involved in cell wall biosynthesis
MKKILYISYDGLLEPLGQSQVLEYQKKLSKNHEIFIISFEKTPFDINNEFHNSTLSIVKSSNISWYRLRYHKRPSGLATAFDIFAGILFAIFLIFRFKLTIIHARSYVPSVIAIVIKKLIGIKFIFDMRGFWADERVDGDIWKKDSLLYKLAKWFESKFIVNADHLVSLTESAINEIKKFKYIDSNMPPHSVIPTCANLDIFTYQPNKNKNFTLGYVGSAGTWYNFDSVIAAFLELLKIIPDATLLIVNQNEHEYILKKLVKNNISQNQFKLISANHSEVPLLMNQMDAGIFFIKQLFSKIASAPTKLGEFLGCGIPCLTNNKIGDMQSIIEEEGVGVSIPDFSQAAILSGVQDLIYITQVPDISNKCIRSSKKYFSLSNGVNRYDEIYSSI